MQCNRIIDNYLLNKNIIYKNRNLISLMIALISAEYIKLTKIELINKFIIPVCLYIVCMFLLEILITMILNNKERQDLKEKCILWINDPDNKKKKVNDVAMMINLEEIKKYEKTKENFETEKIKKDIKKKNKVVENYKNNKNKLIEKVLKPQNINNLNNAVDLNVKRYSNLQNPPVPGPQWNPQSAQQVQDRLNKGMYVSSFCPVV